MRLAWAFPLIAASSAAAAADATYAERVVHTGHAITVAFFNPGAEPARTVLYCSASLPEGVGIMDHDRMGGLVLVAPAVVVLKNVGKGGAPADPPFIRIECRAP